MKVVILGAAGMLGRSLVELCQRDGTRHLALGRSEFDLLEPDLSRLDVEAGDLVINAGAYTAVDAAETDESNATLVNAHTPAAVAAHCEERGAQFAFVSTDYVFDGCAREPYKPGSTHAPINAYGRSKSLGESLVRAASRRALIVRTSWVFAPWGKNFVLTMAELMATRPEVRVVADQVGCPTYAPDLAAAVLGLMRAGESGTWHFTNGVAVSWYEFASAIAELLELGTRILPVASSEFPRPAQRPAYSVLDSSATFERLGPPPRFRERLRESLGHEANS